MKKIVMTCDMCGEDITSTPFSVLAIEQTALEKLMKKLPKDSYVMIFPDIDGPCVDSILEMFNGVPAEKKGSNSGRPVTVDKGKVIALHKAGRTAGEIVDEVKCGKNTVYRILSEYKNGRSGD